MIYLAEKTRSHLLPTKPSTQSAVLQSLMWQMSALGPMFGQAGYFGRFSEEKVPPAIDRFTAEANRLLAVLDRQLSRSEFVAGSNYSIADVAIWPWISNAAFIGLPLSEYLNVVRWEAAIGNRPAVIKGKSIGQVI